MELSTFEFRARLSAEPLAVVLARRWQTANPNWPADALGAPTGTLKVTPGGNKSVNFKKVYVLDVLDVTGPRKVDKMMVLDVDESSGEHP